MILAEIQRIYAASDGDATRQMYAELQGLGHAGVVAVNLLRACKCSERAKLYRRGHGFITAAYERKDWSIGNLAGSLAQDDLGLRWGWAIDRALSDRGDPHHHIVYVELPTGQVSFHVGKRHAGPDYAGEWDGVKNAAADRIIRWSASLFTARTAGCWPGPAPHSRMIRRRFIGRIARSFSGDEAGEKNVANLYDRGWDIRVFLNDREQDLRCLHMADAAEGWVELIQLTNHSFPVYQRFIGHVEIRLEKPSTPRVPGTPWQW